MKPSLVDTDILSLFFKGHTQVVGNVEAYLARYATITLSIISYYEIVSGLKHRGADKQLKQFYDFVSLNTLLPLTQEAAELAAGTYADLRKRGQPLDDIDLLIGGTAIAYGLVLVTHNRKHFDRIRGLEIEDWVEKKIV